MAEHATAAKEQRHDDEHEEEMALAVESETASEGGGSHARRTADARAGQAALSRMSPEAKKPGGKDAPPTPDDKAAGGGDVAAVRSQITGGDIQAALKAMAKLDGTQQGEVVDGLSATGRAKLAGGMPWHQDLPDGEKALIEVAFEHTPDVEVDSLEKLLAARFNLQKVGAAKTSKDQKGLKWEAGALRRMWKVLADLPPSHVEENQSLEKVVRYGVDKDSQAEGSYDDSTKEADIGYDPATLDQDDHDFSDKKDPMYGANAFNQTVRHEIGHAVDAKLGASDKYCIGNAAGGNWQKHDKGADVAAKMVAASGGAIAGWADASQKAAIVRCLGAAIEGQSYDALEDALAALPFWKDLPDDQRQSITQDPVVQAIELNNVSKEPWMNGADGGVALGGRIFEESYDKEWHSYDRAARERKVSKYQFRAPGEWFAEAYAAYYEPAPKGSTKGFKLESVDPKTKAWFDKNVDTK